MNETYQVLAFLVHIILFMAWRKDTNLNLLVKTILLVLAIWDVVLIMTNMGYVIAP